MSFIHFIQTLFTDTVTAVTTLGILTLINTVLTIRITLYNYNLRKPHLRFVSKAEYNDIACYFSTPPDAAHHPHARCMAVVNVRIYNMSELPITVSRFSLKAFGCEESYYHASTYTEENYAATVPPEGLRRRLLIKEHHLPLPLQLTPFDYVDGLLLFPHLNGLAGERVSVTVSAFTARRKFQWDTEIAYVEASVYPGKQNGADPLQKGL